jgi:hypothetical protein
VYCMSPLRNLPACGMSPFLVRPIVQRSHIHCSGCRRSPKLSCWPGRTISRRRISLFSRQSRRVLYLRLVHRQLTINCGDRFQHSAHLRQGAVPSYPRIVQVVRVTASNFHESMVSYSVARPQCILSCV